MKYRILVTLLLSPVLALPVFAQQTNSNSSAQPAASADRTAAASQTVVTTSREPLQPTSSGDFWDGDEPNAVNLVTHPFARKSYVQRQIRPIRDRINELDALTASNSKMIKDVDGSAQQGIQLVSAKTNEADQHAADAGNKAQTAQLAASQTTAHLSKAEQMVGNIDQYKAGAQTEIRFRPGQTILSKKAKDALDEMAAPLKDQLGYIIEIRGFAPGSGQAAIATSKSMANAVVRYLVLSHEIPGYRIYMVGMGNAPVAAEDGTTAKRTSGGRVEINVLKNDLLSSAQH
ncbi:MAG: OmpA family protein [Terriglobales bacterium]|jgi:outer membrane protein OmpA-like peptidoglycan-associated protein